MAQIRGTAGYNLGHQNPFGGPGSADATSDPSPLDAIREQTSKIEDWLDTLADPVKPYVSISLFVWGLLFLPVSWADSSRERAQNKGFKACTNTLFFRSPATFPPSADS